MKKRICAALLAGIMLFASGTESVAAASLSTPEVTKEVAREDVLEQRELGGLQQTINIRLDASDVTEIYEVNENTTKKGSAAYRSSWDKYSTNYYYNQLNADQKAFWDKLDAMCHELLTGMTNLTERSSYPGIGNFYYTPYVGYSNMTSNEASVIAQMFRMSNPQYYFLQALQGGISSRNLFVLSVYEQFGNGTARAQATNQMFAVVNNYMAQINAQPNDLLKEKMAHDLIIKNVTYDPGFEDSSKNQNEYNQVAYSVFMPDATPNDGYLYTTVCAGYSQAMQLLMNAAGIDCAVVTSEGHEWNIIKLNNTWYCLDLTWDDYDGYGGYELGYYYFNRSDNQFRNDSQAIHHLPESFWNAYLPNLNVADSGATFDNYGTVYTPVASLAAPAITCNNGLITISAPMGGDIYYTTDGSNPSVANTRCERYRAPFKVTGSAKIRAIAVASGYNDSAISESSVAQYKVKFNANGGYFKKKSQKVKDKTFYGGSQYGKCDTPKRNGGYAFLGWYTKKSGGKKITSTTAVSGNVTLYAHWGKIKPKKVSISSLKSKKSKEIVVKIKGNKNATGYQVKYSLKSNMKSAKTRTISENNTVLTKLKKGKKYYVTVRMYQKDSVTGKKSYGQWSKVKAVKVKK